jgi:lipoate-protein ligase B
MLLFQDLGEIDYLSAISIQERIVEKKINGELSADVLFLLEHPPVFTLGRSGQEAHLLERGKAPFYRSSRGGDITYHGPGQMVAYPIVDLKSKLRRDIHRYLQRLEEAAIQVLKTFGVSARRKPPCTGVWVEGRKIASIGIAVKRGITYHGLALNVNVDLAPFGWIVPCGLPGVKITSIQQELGLEICRSRVKAEFLNAFSRLLGYSEVKPLCPDDTRIGSKSDSLEAPIISALKGF